MVTIGPALMTKPRLLMLDEPSLGLAPLLVAKIFDIVRRINAVTGLSVLVDQNAVVALGIAPHAHLLNAAASCSAPQKH